MAEDITNNTQEVASDQAQEAASDQALAVNPEKQPAQAAPKAGGWKWCALAGLLLTLLAWFTMVYGLTVSTCLGIAGLLTSIAACWKSGKGMWRDLSITCIIGTGMLLLVYALFIFGIDIALNMI